jgi:hypothetical protein
MCWSTLQECTEVALGKCYVAVSIINKHYSCSQIDSQGSEQHCAAVLTRSVSAQLTVSVVRLVLLLLLLLGLLFGRCCTSTVVDNIVLECSLGVYNHSSR